MNERIVQAAEQAAEYAVLNLGGEALESELEDGTMVSIPKEFINKFAELVMQECIRVPYDMWDKAELNADIAVKIEHRIKEHFGVEE